MKFYNIMSGEGWAVKGGFSEPMIMAWVGLLVLVVAWMTSKKFMEEDFDSQWSILAGVAYLIMVSLTGSAKWSLLIGIMLFALLGFGKNYILGGGGEYG